MPDRIRILFLAANPVGVKSRLRLDEEFRQIHNKLRAANKRDCFELVLEWAVTPAEVAQALRYHKPHILHFSGHGSKNQGLALENEAGKMFLLDKRALVNLLKILKHNLRMVVLNACYSKDQAKHLQEIVDFTIEMDETIWDEAAILFASHFYNALAFGQSVQTAFELGKGQLELLNIPESNKPEMLVRYGVDQTQSLCEGIADLKAKSSESGLETTGSSGDRYVVHQKSMDVHVQVTGIEFGEPKEPMRVVKDSRVHGKFSRREIRAAVQAVVARRQGTT